MHSASSISITEILEQKGHELKKKTADEYATSCPFCGGVDRFCVWSDSGKYWCRQCKKHGDAIQLFRDLDGMSFEDAAVAVGREDVLKNQNNSDVAKNHHEPGVIKNGAKPKIVKTYDYTDSTGKLLFQVVRFDPKDFRQRRPGDNGTWIWNVKDVDLVLYNLHRVLKSDYVNFVEGEKDAN